MSIQLAIDDCLDFADHALEREAATLRLLFAPGLLAEICRHNALDAAASLADGDLACWPICDWYVVQIKTGGEPDPVAEAILAQVADNLPQAAQGSRTRPALRRPANPHPCINPLA